MALVPIFSPDSEAELIAVVAMLDAHDVPHFVQNAGFGSLYPGPQIALYNDRTILVPEESVAVARELLKEFRSQSDPPRSAATSAPNKLRAVLEVLLFGWFVPGNRYSKRKDGE
jgi:hypothetical protein